MEKELIAEDIKAALIAGKTLVELMAKQTMNYSSILQGVGVSDILKLSIQRW